ncbi:MAG: hypothetical protein WCX82_01975 [archaeon]|jgi:hypothetical protein
MALIKPTVKRLAKRIITEKRFQTGVKYLENNKGTVIPANKKPLVQKTITELQRKYGILEKKANILKTKINKLDLDKDIISEINESRKADVLLIKKRIKRHMFESVKDRLEEGFSPAEILAAGYSPQELALGYFRYEQANKANVKKPNYKNL